MRTMGLLILGILVVLHQDFWFWDRDTIVLGLPVGLTYHVTLCLLAAFTFYLLTRSYLGKPDGDEST